jgi:formate hydrogenlyase subunit 3/multisubunit Na+/H+ antiporter MnhD subunit
MGMLSHGISTGALFILVGQLQERTHTREMDRLSGLWATIPRLSGVGLFFALASMGLPGLGDFVGEFLVLLGTYAAHIWLTLVAALGILASTFYALRFVQRTFHAANVHNWSLPDLSAREVVILAPMIALLVWLGLYPQPVFNTFRPVASALEQYASKESLPFPPVTSIRFFRRDGIGAASPVLSCVNRRNYCEPWKGGALAPPVRRAQLKGPLGPETTRLQGLKPRGLARSLRRG